MEPTAKRDKLEERIAKQEAELAELRGLFEKQAQELESLRTLVTSLSKQVHQWNKDVDDVCAEERGLFERVEQDVQEMKPQVSMHAREIVGHRRQLKKLQKQLGMLDNEVESLDASNDNHSIRIRTNTARIFALEQKARGREEKEKEDKNAENEEEGEEEKEDEEEEEEGEQNNAAAKAPSPTRSPKRRTFSLGDFVVIRYMQECGRCTFAPARLECKTSPGAFGVVWFKKKRTAFSEKKTHNEYVQWQSELNAKYTSKNILCKLELESTKRKGKKEVVCFTERSMDVWQSATE